LDAGFRARERHRRGEVLGRRDPERRNHGHAGNLRAEAQGAARPGPREPDRLRPEARHRRARRGRLALGRKDGDNRREAHVQHGQPARRVARAGSDHDSARRACAGKAKAPAVSELTATGLEKSYRKRKVVASLSLSIASGEVVGLLGPNGAGKTTAFYMIVGLVPCDGGRIELDGEDITSLPMHTRARRGVGYLPQEPSIFRRMTVVDNVKAILETRSDLDDAARDEALESLLEELHVAHLRDHIGMSLSGGERRRVEIARALAANPAFILLDEPFAGVDPLSVHDIQRIARHLADRGIGVLITDHNVRETLGICGRAYIVNQGTILASGSADEILANPEVRKVYLGQDLRL